MSDINELAARQHDDSVRWFPSVHEPITLTGRKHAMMHFAFGASGEVGEIVNKIKKHLGYGDQGAQYSEEWLLEAMRDEIPDAIVYLLDLAAELKIDLVKAMSDKRGVCLGRWEKGYTWTTVPIGHDVPGSGILIDRTPHASGYHVTFHRHEPFDEKWSRYVPADEAVPVALTSRGLVSPHPKNVDRGDADQQVTEPQGDD